MAAAMMRSCVLLYSPLFTADRIFRTSALMSLATWVAVTPRFAINDSFRGKQSWSAGSLPTGNCRGQRQTSARKRAEAGDERSEARVLTKRIEPRIDAHPQHARCARGDGAVEEVERAVAIAERGIRAGEHRRIGA